MQTDLLKIFLPSELLDHFTITNIEELPDKAGSLDIYIDIEENNQLPVGYSTSAYESKGFYNVKTIQDFPIRGKAVYLRIKRRRWRLKADKNEVIDNDYSFISKEVKLTKELSDFLKGTGRDPRRYD
jgi:transposase